MIRHVTFPPTYKENPFPITPQRIPPQRISLANLSLLRALPDDDDAHDVHVLVDEVGLAAAPNVHASPSSSGRSTPAAAPNVHVAKAARWKGTVRLDVGFETRYKTLSELGKGKYGTAYMVQRHHDGAGLTPLRST